MQIETTRFGTIEVPDDAVIRFPKGLYGLNGTRRYCLIRHDDAGQFLWLQAVDAPSVAMIVTDPFRHFPGYEVEIPDPAADELQAESAADVSIYTGITVGSDRASVYANLLGPFVINHDARIGMQLIQDGARYSTRHPLAARETTEAAA